MDERRSAEPKPLGLVQPIFLSPPSTFFLLLLLVLILNHSPRPRRGHMSRLVISISRKTRLKTTEIEMTKKWKKSFFSLLLLICFWLRLYLLPASYEVTSWRRDVFLKLFHSSRKNSFQRKRRRRSGCFSWRSRESNSMKSFFEKIWNVTNVNEKHALAFLL